MNNHINTNNDNNFIKIIKYNDHIITTCEFDKDDIWYYGKHISSLLGYKCAKDAIRNCVTVNNSKLSYKDLLIKYNKINVKHLKNAQPHAIFINKIGLTELLLKTNMVRADKIIEDFGITTLYRYKRKEIEILDELIIFLKELNCNYIAQYVVGTYKIDMYIAMYNLAIEIDEFGHNDRNELYESTRQKYIEHKIGCKFIRINPDDKNFSIIYFLALITKHMLNYSNKNKLE